MGEAICLDPEDHMKYGGMGMKLAWLILNQYSWDDGNDDGGHGDGF